MSLRSYEEADTKKRRLSFPTKRYLHYMQVITQNKCNDEKVIYIQDREYLQDGNRGSYHHQDNIINVNYSSKQKPHNQKSIINVSDLATKQQPKSIQK